jgi:hypothetical protein
VAALAAGQTDPAASAETAYLVLAAGIPLIAAAAVSPGVLVPIVTTAATVALAWFVPFGPVRGALVGVTVTAGLALAALGRAGLIGGRIGPAGAGPGPTERSATTTPSGPAALLRPVPAFGLAFGLQALLRADELLAPPSTAWALVVYAGLPSVGALAVLGLARLAGPSAAGLAAAAALVVGPGFRPATVVALVALPAALVLFERRPAPELTRLRAGLPVGLRIGAGLLLTAPALWSLGAAAISALAGAVLALRHRPVAPVCLGLGALAGGLGVALLGDLGASQPAGAGLPEALALAATVPLLVPSLLVRPIPGLGRNGAATAAGNAVAVLALALAAALALRVDGSLAAPAALAGGLVGSAPRRAALDSIQAGPIQAVWSSTLLAGAALAGSYPWLRAEPLAGALDALGLPPGLPAAAAAVPVLLVVLVLLILLGRSSTVRRGLPGGGASAAGVLLIAALLVRIPQPGTALVREGSPLRLTDRAPEWSARADSGFRPGSVVLDSTLGNAGALPEGTPVATLTLQRIGRPPRSRTLRWTLHAGEETGEWAAGRPELAADPALAPAPRPWLSWVSAERSFFGQTYRAVLPLDDAPAGSVAGAGPADRLELRLRPDLPPEVVLTVFRLELRP